MLKKSALFLVILALIFSVVACQGDEETEPKGDDINNGEEQEEKVTDEETKKVGDGEKRIITLYFADDEAMELVTENVEVVVGDRPIEEVIVNELKKGPREPELGHYPTIGKDIEILDVEVKGNTVLVDFSSDNLSGGSAEEKFLIDSIVMSLTELEYIDKVKFLVDGESEVTLMGHLMINKAFTRDDINQSEE